MPSTYTPIATYITPSVAASYTFTSIPSTYTDLVLVASGGTVAGGGSFYAQFNGDAGTNYSFTSLYGDGTSVISNRHISRTSGFFSGNGVGINATSTTVAHFMNYSNTTTNKTVVTRSSTPAGDVEITATLWRNTSAITSIAIIGTNANVDAGVTFVLYGIKAA